MNVPLALSVSEAEPERLLLPDQPSLPEPPEALQLLENVEVQLSVNDSPGLTEAGLAVRVTLGAPTVTAALAEALSHMDLGNIEIDREMRHVIEHRGRPIRAEAPPARTRPGLARLGAGGKRRPSSLR